MSSIIIASLSSALLMGAAQLATLTSANSLEPNGQAPKLVPLQKYGGDPHGPDPHGDDPRDEQHDPDLPANQDRSKGKAPKDVYGGQYPNGQAPY
ncbi:hypothetical protein KBI23_13370 [bacterium]|nr:hypothetical protein [bacterium]MBP9807548.1 hypothetical protein [bacterium]